MTPQFPEPSFSLREFVSEESLPLATIQTAVLDFIRDRNDVAVFGAQAVNVYVATPRMTQDVDLLSTSAGKIADEICKYLHDKFMIAVRVRSVAAEAGFRVYQQRTPKNRHLVDVRQSNPLPDTQIVERIQVVTPSQLIAMKVVSMSARIGTPKGLTDEADLLRLLIEFPEQKSLEGAVSGFLVSQNANEHALQVWQELVAREIPTEDDDSY